MSTQEQERSEGKRKLGPQTPEGLERATANLRPIRDPATARELGLRGIEAKREKARAREQAQAEADERVREDLAKLAYRRLYEMLEGDEKQYWGRSVEQALDRLEGKPTQRTESQTQETVLVRDMTTEELQARLAQLQAVSPSPEPVTDP